MTITGDALAEKIAMLQREELKIFMRHHLRRKDLHKIVANLNETAVSGGDPYSGHARKALKRLGFAE